MAENTAKNSPPAGNTPADTADGSTVTIAPIAGQARPAGAAPATPAAPPPPADHRVDGKLTRAGMEHAIRAGGSVIHDGRVVSRIEDLPTEAQLAKGNTAAEDAALNNINRQRAELDAQEAQLKAGRNPPAKPAK